MDYITLEYPLGINFSEPAQKYFLVLVDVLMLIKKRQDKLQTPACISEKTDVRSNRSELSHPTDHLTKPPDHTIVLSNYMGLNPQSQNALVGCDSGRGVYAITCQLSCLCLNKAPRALV